MTVVNDLRRQGRGLPRAHRRWILVNAIVGAACVNVVLNAAIAWVGVAGVDTVPLWSVPLLDGTSTVTDTVATLFMLPLVTCLLCTPAIWRELRTGRLTPLRRVGVLGSLSGRLPAGRVRRGLVFGAVCTALLGPPVVLAIVALHVGELSVRAFVTYKVAFAVGLGALVTPVIAVCAMTDTPPGRAEES